MNRNSRTLKGLALSVAVCAMAGTGVAEACSVAAWTASNTNATNANAVQPPGAANFRYYGSCALRLDAASAPLMVGDNSPAGAAETTYRARFYFFTGLTAGSAQIFRATSDDNNGGSEVLSLSLASSGSLTFAINGATVETIAGLAANRWYAVEISYVGGTSYSIDVRGNRTFTASEAGATAVNTGIGSHSLGLISVAGAAGNVQFDEFEASRATAAIGFYPRGNANIDGSGAIAEQQYTLFDVLDALTEFRTGTLSAGNADAEEDGDVDLLDVLAILTRFRTGSFPT